MLGTQMQKVPKYSAVKVDGKRLYKYARQGLEVECPKKEITIYKLHLCYCDDEKIVFEVHCSRGTYVRTIGEDIAQRLGTVGYLSELERIASGQFTQEQAIQDFSALVTDNDLQDLIPTIEENIVDIQSLFPFQTFELEAEWLPKIANGQRLPLSLLPSLQIDQKLILMHKNKICALGQREGRSLRYLCVLI
jgi:tRNA pseudouridine55 synthase